MEIFKELLHGLREACSGFSDSRRSADGIYTMADIGLSAFSLFFMQNPNHFRLLRLSLLGKPHEYSHLLQRASHLELLLLFPYTRDTDWIVHCLNSPPANSRWLGWRLLAGLIGDAADLYSLGR